MPPALCPYCGHVNTLPARPKLGQLHYCDNPRGCKADAWAIYTSSGWVWKRERKIVRRKMRKRK